MPVKTRMGGLTVSTEPMQLVEENPRRKCLTVLNNGTDTVYLLASGNDPKSQGIPIYAGKQYVNWWSHAAYWVVAENGRQDIRFEENFEET